MRQFWLVFFALVLFGVPLIHAATDGVDVTLTVEETAPPGGGGGDPPGPDPVPGCTDAAANNYNPAATQNDGSCSYPVPNVSGLAASYDAVADLVRLTWQNPSFAAFAGVRVLRGDNFFPTGPSDGLLIYDGGGQAATDAGVSAGNTYYYSVFVRNTSGDYSSGSVVSENVSTPEEEEEEPPPDEDEPPGSDDEPGPGDGEGPGPADPFASFPLTTSPDPLILQLDLGDFIFAQPGERRQFFIGGEAIDINASKPLTVMIAAARLPEALKAIGLTVLKPGGRGALASFLLRSSGDQQNYLASLGPFLTPGTYPFYIHILNFRDQSIKRLVGNLVVSGVGSARSLPLAIAERVVVPLAIATGLAGGVIEGLALSAKVASFSDLYLLLLNLVNVVLRALGLKKRQKPWGVVYDSITKRPIDPAYVVVRRIQDDVNTAITDLDGRYGFFLPAGDYNLAANKTHYIFPSTKLAGRNSDELYGDLYFGGDFSVGEGLVINKNIPLDPVGFDWNEFAKNQRGFFYLHQKRERARRLFFNLLYGGGLLLTAYQVLFRPSLLNIVVLALYFAAFGLKYLWRYRRPIVVVKHATTGLPVPFALVRAFIPGVDNQIKSVAADALGRFFLLTPPGDYYLTVEEKLPDGTYHKIHQTPTLHLSRGLVTKNLVV